MLIAGSAAPRMLSLVGCAAAQVQPALWSWVLRGHRRPPVEGGSGGQRMHPGNRPLAVSIGCKGGGATPAIACHRASCMRGASAGTAGQLILQLGMQHEGAGGTQLRRPAAALSCPSSRIAADMDSQPPTEQLSTCSTRGGLHPSSQLTRSSAGSLMDTGHVLTVCQRRGRPH